LKSSLIICIFLFLFLALSCKPVLAQEIAPALKARVPFARTGLFFGRTGTAEGPGAYLEINPIRWVGFCGIVSHSETIYGIVGGKARVTDLLTGGCVTLHSPEINGFLISPFGQMSNQNEHNRIVIPLPDGTVYYDGDNHLRHIWTAGATIDRAITKNGPRWVARFGKNFGDGPAVQNAEGLYFVGGVIFPLDHPVELRRSFRRMVGWKPHTADPAAVHP